MRARGVGVTAVVEPLSNRGNVGEVLTIVDRRTYFIRCEAVVRHRTDCCGFRARSKMDQSLVVVYSSSFDSACAQGAAEAALDVKSSRARP